MEILQDTAWQLLRIDPQVRATGFIDANSREAVHDTGPPGRTIFRRHGGFHCLCRHGCGQLQHRLRSPGQDRKEQRGHPDRQESAVSTGWDLDRERVRRARYLYGVQPGLQSKPV
jgi:hypothetical protein